MGAAVVGACRRGLRKEPGNGEAKLPSRCAVGPNDVVVRADHEIEAMASSHAPCLVVADPQRNRPFVAAACLPIRGNHCVVGE